MTDARENNSDWLLIRIDQDEQLQHVRLSDFNLTLPSVGIFDEPTRCYKVNVQWAKIISGAVDLLTEIAVWRDATNEGYTGIRQIIQFLEGIPCMDCNDVETCLLSSPTIAAIQAAIQANTNDIATNTNDIATNAQAIADNASDIQVNAQQLNLHSAQIADHETRITALEQAGGGGGATHFEEIRVYEKIHDGLIAVANNSHLVANIPQFYDDLYIRILARGQTSGGNNVYMYANNDFTSLNYRRIVVSGTVANDAFIGQAEQFAYTPDYYTVFHIEIPRYTETRWKTALSNYGRDLVSNQSHWTWKNTANITDLTFQVAATLFDPGTRFEVWGIRTREVYMNEPSLTSPITVTFDPAGYGYEIESVGANLIVSTGGNPNNCAFTQSLSINDVARIKIDLQAQRTITGITWDAFTDAFANVGYALFVDGQVVRNGEQLGTQNFVWESLNDTMYAGGSPFPMAGQTIWLALQNNDGFDDKEVRIDNIQVSFT